MIKIKQRKHKNGKNIRELMELSMNYFEAGNLRQAADICEDILKEQPENHMFLHFLGEIRYKLGDYNGALENIRKSLEINPDNADAYNNLGVVLQEMGQLDEAITCYQKLLQLNPKYSDAYANLGTVFRSKGKIDDAEMYFRLALQLEQNDPITYSNLLLTMNYNSRHEARTMYLEHLNFAKQFEGPLAFGIASCCKERSSGRRIRIGYVSPDFRRHSVNYFFEPVIASHNRNLFEIFCYSDVLAPDDVTERLQEYADQWRNIVSMSDEIVAEIIRKDGIDILIDLAGHTGHNRMLLFARKPAPVQVSWLGYPNTTGLSTVDYRIVDAYTDPPGLTDPYYTEELIRLPQTFLCYLPDENSPDVDSLPALKTGHITFGSFNFFAKISPEVIGLWAEILRKVPGSRMVIKAKSLSDKSTCAYAMQMFTREEIAPNRIELLSYEPSYRGHLDIYNRVDISLDTFPYNGTTTTCEAIWMGCPVITLSGSVHASRVGVSILSNIGLEHLIAKTRAEYFTIAVDLANDLKRLQSLRHGLRSLMYNSPLTDAKRFTLNLESRYRLMWQNYCQSN
jgi:protein O-GlcNAc transferase